MRQILFLVSDAQKILLDELARAKKMTRADYIRTMCKLQGDDAAAPAREAPPSICDSDLIEFVRVKLAAGIPMDTVMASTRRLGVKRVRFVEVWGAHLAAERDAAREATRIEMAKMDFEYGGAVDFDL